MNKPSETQPSAVPEAATQVGEVRFRWSWTERAVWTERMLTALEQGVKGNCWFSLIDKVYSEKNLLAALTKVFVNGGAPGVDHVTVEQFDHDWNTNLESLSEQL